MSDAAWRCFVHNTLQSGRDSGDWINGWPSGFQSPDSIDGFRKSSEGFRQSTEIWKIRNPWRYGFFRSWPRWSPKWRSPFFPWKGHVYNPKRVTNGRTTLEVQKVAARFTNRVWLVHQLIQIKGGTLNQMFFFLWAWNFFGDWRLLKFQSRKKKCNWKCWDSLTKQGEVPKMSAVRWSPQKCGEAIPNQQTKNDQKLPGTQMTSIFEGQPPQNKALSIQSKGPHLGSRYWNAPSHFFGTFFQLYRKRQEAAVEPLIWSIVGKGGDITPHPTWELLQMSAKAGAISPRR